MIYSEATETLPPVRRQTGIPVGETMAGKGSLPFDHPLCLGAIGATGTLAANRIARDADLVIGIGTRYSRLHHRLQDRVSGPRRALHQHQRGRVRRCQARRARSRGRRPRHAGGAAVSCSTGYQVDPAYRQGAEALHAAWEAEVDRIYAIRHQPLPSQGELIGAVNEHGDPEAIMVCAAGSLPGDLHKLWRARHPKQYHLEYGYSCMGYEIAGGLGIKMAAPDREVYVLVGDGSYLMLSSEIVTSIQEGVKLTIVLLDNDGYKSIGALSRSLGQSGFGTRYVFPHEGSLPGDELADQAQRLPVDLAANAESLGAHVIRCQSYDDVVAALKTAASHRKDDGHLRPQRPTGGRARLRLLVGRAGRGSQRDARGPGEAPRVGADAREGAAVPGQRVGGDEHATK